MLPANRSSQRWRKRRLQPVTTTAWLRRECDWVAEPMRQSLARQALPPPIETARSRGSGKRNRFTSGKCASSQPSGPSAPNAQSSAASAVTVAKIVIRLRFSLLTIEQPPNRQSQRHRAHVQAQLVRVLPHNARVEQIWRDQLNQIQWMQRPLRRQIRAGRLAHRMRQCVDRRQQLNAADHTANQYCRGPPQQSSEAPASHSRISRFQHEREQNELRRTQQQLRAGQQSDRGERPISDRALHRHRAMTSIATSSHGKWATIATTLGCTKCSKLKPPKVNVIAPNSAASRRNRQRRKNTYMPASMNG